MYHHYSPILFFLCVILGILHAGPDGHATGNSHTCSSFLDRIDGTFDDSGENAYVAADGSIRLINQWDLTGNGWVDILLPNSHGYNEIVDFSIYWARDDWSQASSLQLPSDGGHSAQVGDLNGNGYPDIVLVNRFNGTKSELDLWIYWGGPDGYSAGHRTSLPLQAAERAVLADLNGNGYLDIVVANTGLSYHVSVDSYGKSYIFWNREGSFSADDRTELPTIHAKDVIAADLNGNGWLDLAFANQGNEESEAGLRIFYNQTKENFSEAFQFLPGERSSAVAAADLNQNGHLDLVVANAFRLADREGGIYNIVDTSYLHSTVYWGGPDGFSANRRTDLPTVSAQDVAIGDLNHNGWPDLVFAQSADGASFIYWGGPDGFHSHRRSAVPGTGHVTVEVTDLNGNGWNELLLRPSHADGYFDTKVEIYWGGKDGPELSTPKLLPASGAGGVTVADLDGNGRMDLVVVNRGDGPQSARTPAYLYPGGPEGFDPQRRMDLPTHGSDGYLGVDLNANGYTDLIFLHRPPTIFRGGPEGLDLENPTTLSSQYAFSARAADFNRDGYLDVVLSEWQPGLDKIHVYFGGPGGFNQAHRQALPVRSARFHTIADLNNNGWLDIIVPNFIDEEVHIFWNGPQGLDTSNPRILPVRSSVAVEVADLNGNGFLDLIVPNLFDKNPEPGKPRSFGGSPQGDTFIFWGGPDGPEPGNLTILPSVGSADVVAADLNNNGRLDLVIASYHAGETRSLPSYIYWNSDYGFSPENVTRIPTHSASGVKVADFNRNGWKDIFFANHSKDGNHRTDTWLYFGGPEGFTEDRRQSLPGLGPHFLTAVDIGHVANRRDAYIYTAPAYDAGRAILLKGLRWEAETPHQTAVHLQLRTATSREALDQASWIGADGPGSWFQNPEHTLQNHFPPGSWVQWRARLISPDSANSPVLRDVTLEFQENRTQMPTS